jgi:hypothetical protein
MAPIGGDDPQDLNALFIGLIPRRCLKTGPAEVVNANKTCGKKGTQALLNSLTVIGIPASSGNP